MSRRVGRRNVGRDLGDSGSTNIKSEGVGAVICKCKLPALVQTSGTELNPGRQMVALIGWIRNVGAIFFVGWIQVLIYQRHETMMLTV
ncbi:unnamed protein product [Linum trigynum]|uniref:Uncharacterized protein n=1 Tax=Linum trigynum TaxID=586398 RepID=A0AAV2FU28_9ROSI